MVEKEKPEQHCPVKDKSCLDLASEYEPPICAWWVPEEEMCALKVIASNLLRIDNRLYDLAGLMADHD